MWFCVFKQKTAYEMRMSDWSSDVCSSDLLPEFVPHTDARSWFAGNDALAETTAFRNSSLQGAYFLLAARALGLDTGPMSGFDNAAVDRAFFADQPKVKSNFISTLGYGDPASILDRKSTRLNSSH